jgi:hypothetical protein
VLFGVNHAREPAQAIVALEQEVVVPLDDVLRQKHRVDEALEAEDAAVGEVVHSGVHHHEMRGEDQRVARREAARVPGALDHSIREKQKLKNRCDLKSF